MKEEDYLALEGSKLNRDLILDAPFKVRPLLLKKYRAFLEEHMLEFSEAKEDNYLRDRADYMTMHRKKNPLVVKESKRKTRCRIKIKKAAKQAIIIKDLVNEKIREERDGWVEL